MRPLLTYNGYASGGARAYSLGANSYTQIGEIIGTVDAGATVDSFLVGKIAQIQNTIYVLHQRAIKKKNSDGTWSTVVSLSNAYSAQGVDYMNQMIPCAINGTQYLVCLYVSSPSSSTNACYYRAGVYNVAAGTLTTSGEVQITAGLNGSVDAILNRNMGYPFYYDGVVYFPIDQKIITVNVTSGSATVSNFGTNWGGVPTCSFAVYNNELYMLFNNAGNGVLYLYKLVGSTFVSAATVAPSQAWTNGNARTCLFSDGTYLYAMALLNTNTWKMYRLNSSLTSTDVTSSVIPGFTGQAKDSRFRFVCDQHASPTNPEFYLIFQTNIVTGGVNRFYRFTDGSTQLQYIGSAGEGGMINAIATPQQGGGEMMYRDGEMHIEYIGAPTVSQTPGNMTVHFRIYESDMFPSGYPVNVKMFSSADRAVPTIPCRLTNPQPYGSIQNSYTITGITAGSGVLYSVDWRAAADGFDAGDAVTMVASVSGVI